MDRSEPQQNKTKQKKNKSNAFGIYGFSFAIDESTNVSRLRNALQTTKSII